MSIYPNVTQQDLINSSKLAEQQKNHRAIKIKNRNLKQTHDKTLAENLSPITKYLDIVNETTKNLGELVKKSDVEDDDTQTLAIENTRNDIQPGVIYDTTLENTLSNMIEQKGFFKIRESPIGDLF